jgi:exopolysaccharide biosynthesis polyprenyl glycosylphosphotransferase
VSAGVIKDLPFVSVAVPTYNHAGILPQCIRAVLDQTYPADRYELIVIDDGSADGTPAVLAACESADPRVRFASQRNRGPAAARNHGADLARGEILVFTDDDCVPERTWLAEMVRPFLSSPEPIAGVKGAYKTRQGELVAQFVQAEFESRYRKLGRSAYIDFVDTYSAAFRRDVFLQLGGFDTSFPKANNEDVEFSYRMEKRGHRMVFNPAAVVYHRHPDTLFRYMKTKFGRAFWRMVVYQSFPEKMRADSYTPQSLKLQIGLGGLFLLGLAGMVVRPGVLDRWVVGLGALFLLSTAPFIFRLIRLRWMDALLDAFVRLLGLASPRRLAMALREAVRRNPACRAVGRMAAAASKSATALALTVGRGVVRPAVAALRLACRGMRCVGRAAWHALAAARRSIITAWRIAAGLTTRAVRAGFRWGIAAPLQALGWLAAKIIPARLALVVLAPFFLFLRAIVMGMGILWGLRGRHVRTRRFSHFVMLLIADALGVTMAFAAAFSVRYALPGAYDNLHCPLEAYYYLYPCLIVLTIAAFAVVGLYRPRRGVATVNELVLLAKATVAVAVMSAVGMYLARYIYSRIFVVAYFALAMAAIPFCRWFIQGLFSMSDRTRKEGATSRVIIVGVGELAQYVHQRFRTMPEFFDARIVGFVAPDGEAAANRDAGPVLGGLSDIEKLIVENDVTDLFVALPQAEQRELMQVVHRCSCRPGVRCHVVSNMFDLMSAELDMVSATSIPVASLRNENMAVADVLLKRTLDVALAAFFLLLTAPLWLIVAIAIRLESEGRALFRQERVGKDGRIFRIFKFRTMHAAAPKFDYAPQEENDARVTKVGRFLRRTSLDELPQLINVFRGEMSLVGPRPEMPFIVEKYSDWERQRLKVKPGVTGLWQIMGRKDLPLHESIEYDFYYIKNQSLLLDLAILIRTIGVVLGGKGAY